MIFHLGLYARTSKGNLFLTHKQLLSLLVPFISVRSLKLLVISTKYKRQTLLGFSDYSWRAI